MKLRGLVSNSYIHVSKSDLCIPTIGLPSLLQENRSTDPGNIQIAHRYMNVEFRTVAAQFLFGEYINQIFFAVHAFLVCSYIAPTALRFHLAVPLFLVYSKMAAG